MISANKTPVFDDDVLCRTLMAEILSDQTFGVADLMNQDVLRNVLSAEFCPEKNPCADLIVTDNQIIEMTELGFLENLKQKNCKIPDKHKAVISDSLSAEDLEKANLSGEYKFSLLKICLPPCCLCAMRRGPYLFVYLGIPIRIDKVGLIISTNT